MSNIITENSSTYYFTTAQAIQAAVVVSLQFDSANQKKYVNLELFNQDPRNAAPIDSSRHEIGTQDIFSLSGPESFGSGQVALNGGFNSYDPGITIDCNFTSPYYHTRIHGFIGAFNGDGPKESLPFKFGHHLDWPQNKHTVQLGRQWVQDAGDQGHWQVHWAFSGIAGVVDLDENGNGTLSYDQNGIFAKGTFADENGATFTGVFLLHDVVQLGFTNASYAGYLGPSYNIR